MKYKTIFLAGALLIYSTVLHAMDNEIDLESQPEQPSLLDQLKSALTNNNVDQTEQLLQSAPHKTRISFYHHFYNKYGKSNRHDLNEKISFHKNFAINKFLSGSAFIVGIAALVYVYFTKYKKTTYTSFIIECMAIFSVVSLVLYGFGIYRVRQYHSNLKIRRCIKHIDQLRDPLLKKIKKKYTRAEVVENSL